ncbi:hypothetical protein HELRODRAFT_162969 [Helobdella robusta]|uniref:Endonuclease/exonuclease/phosphatase domain-containing protein n=1 Tax=Helobdella robusta TaxID=6412 RepID=T1ETG4_HELRO|nr:hypothetical protein HELRODRAFT_162969 [Helobdella robusta]ESN99421.1 hypothetical protein HELRODRAFT_162969 [Helobdella robusta]
MVREKLVEKVLEVRRKSNGVIVVVMVFGKVRVKVISGYAPQQSRKEKEKDGFYDYVSDEIGQAGLDEFVVLMGDLNGHVGADTDGYECAHGEWGYGIWNEEGRRVLELANAHSMVVGNTWFTREPAQLITYRSGEHRSMIDSILIRAKHKKYVRNVKAISVEVRTCGVGFAICSTIFKKSFQTFHALKTLRSHGLRGIKLFDITESLIISRIKYAAPSRSGFAKQQQLQQLQSLIKKLIRFSYLPASYPTVTQIFNTLDTRLFKKVENNNTTSSILYYHQLKLQHTTFVSANITIKSPPNLHIRKRPSSQDTSSIFTIKLYHSHN